MVESGRVMKKKEKKIKKKVGQKKSFGGIYISFTSRLIIYFILFVVFFGMGLGCIVHSLDIIKEDTISFNENGNVNYSVCLSENEFYEDKCLGKNMSYVAGLIQKIPLDFSYQFMVNKDEQVQNLSYEIFANLVIVDEENSSKYYEKKYVIQTKTNDSIEKNGKYSSLNRNIDIDYRYYNDIATKFKAQYGIDASSYLEVYLLVYHQMPSEYSIPSMSRVSIKIPLSQKAIQIQMDTSGVKNQGNHVITKSEFSISNGVFLGVGIAAVVFSILYIIIVLRMVGILLGKKSKYDQFLGKILKEYDRLIVETSTLPDFEDYQVMKIKSFNELLDVRDNLRLPIMYYSVMKRQKAHFYILQDKNLYLFTLKAVDLEKEK